MRHFNEYLKELTRSSECEEIEVIQSLWSNYGKISRYRLNNPQKPTVVVKHISMTQPVDHPRGWNTDISHQRKIRSYEIETYWYKNWNKLCSESSKTPEFLGAFDQGSEQWIVLEDLDTHYPIRKHRLTLPEAKTCLIWLANFHATFLGKEPTGLWPTGTYWHLDTRPEEFERIEHAELRSKAHRINEVLESCAYQTIVHGDAKVANFCFSESGKEIAVVDFQYVGRGCGMKDVAYFLGSCLSDTELESYAEDLLEFYFEELRQAIELSGADISISHLEQEWRRMYAVAWTDFTRFLLGWMPSHQKVNGYSLRLMKMVLAEL